MPKLENTRKDRALKLRDRLETGPRFAPVWTGQRINSAEDYESICIEFERSTRIWLQTWIIDDVKDLVPELRKN